MKLKLNNIAAIKEADINLNSLTVIAGENDQGKSTVGRVLYALIKTIRWSSNTQSATELKQVYINNFNKNIRDLFKGQISKAGSISFEYLGEQFHLVIKNDRCVNFDFPQEYKNTEPKAYTPLLIETPYIWNIFPSLKTINALNSSENEIDFEVSQVLKDLYSALTVKLQDNDYKIKIDVESIINGRFEESGLGEYIFRKGEEKIELANLAMGIKYFGLLQVLSNKNYLFDGQILILDEPEVHLHPKWQVELVKVIIKLVERGVKILVNSHSPYMIEAFQRYSQKREIVADFYLAENGFIIEDDQALSKIFAKLSEPFDEFDQMDSEILNG